MYLRPVVAAQVLDPYPQHPHLREVFRSLSQGLGIGYLSRCLR